MHHDMKISGSRIRTHDRWIRKRVCYPLHHSAPRVANVHNDWSIQKGQLVQTAGKRLRRLRMSYELPISRKYITCSDWSKTRTASSETVAVNHKRPRPKDQVCKNCKQSNYTSSLISLVFTLHYTSSYFKLINVILVSESLASKLVKAYVEGSLEELALNGSFMFIMHNTLP